MGHLSCGILTWKLQLAQSGSNAVHVSDHDIAERDRRLALYRPVTIVKDVDAEDDMTHPVRELRAAATFWSYRGSTSRTRLATIRTKHNETDLQTPDLPDAATGDRSMIAPLILRLKMDGICKTWQRCSVRMMICSDGRTVDCGDGKTMISSDVRSMTCDGMRMAICSDG